MARAAHPSLKHCLRSAITGSNVLRARPKGITGIGDPLARTKSGGRIDVVEEISFYHILAMCLGDLHQDEVCL